MAGSGTLEGSTAGARLGGRGVLSINLALENPASSSSPSHPLSKLKLNNISNGNSRARPFMGLDLLVSGAGQDWLV